MIRFVGSRLACLRQSVEDCFHQSLCRFWTELYSDSRAGSIFVVDEIDVQSMIQLRVSGMIVGDVDLFQLEPSVRTLAATRYFRSLDYACAHLLSRPSRRSKIFLEKREHLLPAVDRRFRAIGYAGIVEEAVPCARVHVKLVILSILLQLLLQLADILGCRVLVLFSKQAE